MNACPNKIDTLMLDVYGELGPAERQSWETHLKTCAGCKLEKGRLLDDLKKIRHAVKPQPLTAKQRQELACQVRRKLAKQKRSASWKDGFGQHRIRFIPAIAVACLLVLLTGLSIFLYVEPTPNNHVAVVDDTLNQIKAEDLEILQHFELLENMPTLQKLVHIVDHAQGEETQEKNRQDFRGNTANDKDQIRV